MNYKVRTGNNGRNFDDEFFIRFKGVSVHLTKKILNQEKNYRKLQQIKKRWD